jgi:hypothetical protein
VGADAEPGDPLAGNPGMEQKVRIRSEGIAVGDLMALISKETGVDVTARSDVCFRAQTGLYSIQRGQ